MTSSHCKTSRLELAELFRAALTELGKRSKRESIGHFIARQLLFGADARGMLRGELITEFRQSAAFQALIKFAEGQEHLMRVVMGSNVENPDVFRVCLDTVFLQALISIVYGPAATSWEEMVSRFFDFLEVETIERYVTVPLHHISMSEAELEIENFGRLFLTELWDPPEGDDPVAKLLYEKRCNLRFRVQTGKYISAENTRVADFLRVRVALLRFVVNPLISFNHFSIQHASPWEFPLSDTRFYERFWGRSTVPAPHLSSSQITRGQATEIGRLFTIFGAFDWRKTSPWRLALNRLDDAVFKLECASADALLDLVIGLEAVMVEADSTQESTHKVALRAARFLEAGSPERELVFRKVKRLYATRSKIAHGKAVDLDGDVVPLLREGATLLCRALSKMLEIGQTELSLSQLDLA